MTEINDEHPTIYLVVDDSRVFSANQDIILIGRSPRNDFVIPNSTVSRNHAKIRYINNRFLLIDTASSGGTFVNDRPIVQKLLQPGDLIKLAEEVFFVFQVDLEALPESWSKYSPKEKLSWEQDRVNQPGSAGNERPTTPLSKNSGSETKD